ncbi:MAG: capsular biosynthesis protein [Bacillus sp. (in: Bacteria)]|nr:capsular biosynthesis protein [Bacillus sp. (in: firmicutes)]
MNMYRPINNLDKRVAKDINIKELFNVIKKRFWLIAFITVLVGVTGIFYSSLNTTLLYQSSAKIIISADAELMKTLHVIIKDSTVLEKVVDELNLERSPEGLAGQITVESIEGSQVVSIKVVDTNPKVAADIANTTAKVFKEEVPGIIEFNDVRFLSRAKVNPYPINENSNRTIIMAFIGGLIVGIGLAFLLDSFDDTIRSDREIEELLGIPVLGCISIMNKKNIKKKGHYQMEVNFRGETSVSK